MTPDVPCVEADDDVGKVTLLMVQQIVASCAGGAQRPISGHYLEN